MTYIKQNQTQNFKTHKEVKETANIKGEINENTFLHYYNNYEIFKTSMKLKQNGTPKTKKTQ
jgi:hypothetical protein